MAVFGRICRIPEKQKHYFAGSAGGQLFLVGAQVGLGLVGVEFGTRWSIGYVPAL